MTVISYPIPPYQNVPIAPQYYLPSRFAISAVILGMTTLVTTSVNHNYVINQIVRLIIPNTYGCRQLNEKQGYVISIPSANQVQIQINSIGFDSFKSSSQTTQPQILAVGNYNNGSINNQGRVNQGTFVPGSFINISPQ